MNFVVCWPRLRRWYDTPPEPEPESNETLEETIMRLCIVETIREAQAWYEQAVREIDSSTVLAILNAQRDLEDER